MICLWVKGETRWQPLYPGEPPCKNSTYIEARTQTVNWTCEERYLEESYPGRPKFKVWCRHPEDEYSIEYEHEYEYEKSWPDYYNHPYTDPPLIDEECFPA